jgi:phosphomannomutase
VISWFQAFAFNRNLCRYIVVLQTTQGLCDYVMQQIGDDEARSRGVVLGFDGRHHSRQFAHTAARVLASRGVKAGLSRYNFANPVHP